MLGIELSIFQPPVDRLQCGLIVDAAARIYITDSEDDRIVRINNMSRKGSTWLGERGGKQFSEPRGIFVDGAGRIYIADASNHRIVRMDDMTGAGWTALGTCSQPHQCAGTKEVSQPRGI